MKKKTVFGTVLFVLLVLQAQTVFANGESESSSRSNNTPQEPPPNDPWSGVVLTGETEPMFEGTIWAHIDDADDILEFRAGGRLVNRRIITVKYQDGSVAYTIPASANGTWQYDGNVLKFVIHTSYYTLPGNSYRFYLYPSYREGKYYLQTQRVMGIAKNHTGREYDFTLIPSTGAVPSMAQQPTAPSSTTNVYVQPSAPAQSPAPAPSTPTFQSGRYAFSGSNITMSLSGYQATAYSGYTQVAWGTYRINGNQLVITFNTGNGAGANLQGKTFAYTITSDASFSGGGETWVRTGY